MKALIVMSDSCYYYGAWKSMSELLRNLDYDFDLVIGRGVTVTADETEVRGIISNDHCKKIMPCFVSRYRCYQGVEKKSLWTELSHVVNNILALLTRPHLKRIIREGGYDYVHLNSSVLFPQLSDDHNYIIHIREAIDPHYFLHKLLKRKLSKANEILCIDKTAKERVLMIGDFEDKSDVLNNPFDMKRVAELDHASCRAKYGIDEDKVVFAMIGQIMEDKGAEFVLRSFHSCNREDQILLMVGSDSHPYAQSLKDKYKDDPRIRFCGEVENALEFYSFIDYVVRGDLHFGIGRTHYEGIYAGCHILIPGTPQEADAMPSIEGCRELIHTYSPRNEAELKKLFEEAGSVGYENRIFRSNIEGYMDGYLKIVHCMLEESTKKKG